MGEEVRRHHRIMTFIPVGIHFATGNPAEGWGRIRNVSVGGVELETHFVLKNGQKIYLSFSIEGWVFVFQHVPARVVRAKNILGAYSAGISFEDELDREHLREALVYLVNRI